VELLVNRLQASQALINTIYTREVLSASLAQALADQFPATWQPLADLIVTARATFASRYEDEAKPTTSRAPLTTQYNSRYGLAGLFEDSLQATFEHSTLHENRPLRTPCSQLQSGTDRA
jgi:hypothetical protein